MELHIAAFDFDEPNQGKLYCIVTFGLREKYGFEVFTIARGTMDPVDATERFTDLVDGLINTVWYDVPEDDWASLEYEEPNGVIVFDKFHGSYLWECFDMAEVQGFTADVIPTYYQVTLADTTEVHPLIEPVVFEDRFYDDSPSITTPERPRYLN